MLDTSTTAQGALNIKCRHRRATRNSSLENDGPFLGLESPPPSTTGITLKFFVPWYKIDVNSKGVRHLLKECVFTVLALVGPIDKCLGRFTMGGKRSWLGKVSEVRLLIGYQE